MKNLKWQKEWPGVAFVLFLVFTILGFGPMAFAYDEGSDEDDANAVALESNLGAKKDKSPAMSLKKNIEARKPKPVLPAEKTLIRELNIIGSTLLAREEIDRLYNTYNDKNKSLTGKEMQRLADLISRAYNRNGYITSYAYIEADKLAQGILEIRVIEGKTGKIEIKGNKYFSTELLRKKFTLHEGEPFNFMTLTKDVYRVNKHQDRKVSLQLETNPQTNATDIVITVKDKLPLHMTFQADNYGAETILYNRYKTFFITNNLSGNDDSLTAKIEWSEGDSHKIYDLDYVIPLNNQWKFEFYLLPYKSEDYYYKDNKDTDFEKRARKWYFWFYQSLIEQPDFDLVSSYGFTYFDIFWYKPYDEYMERTRADRYRILKWDISLNKADKHGRWIFTNDLQKGIPNLWGGVPGKSDESSMKGAKGSYVKNLMTLARRQRLFAGIDFIGKARWQASSATLTGVNAFSVGGYCGVIDNRGYPRTQAPGDSGRALNLGLTFPAYFIPRTINAPLSAKTKLYDSLKLFTFWDWGQSIIKSPKPATVAGDPDDKKITTLISAGCGFTYAVPDQALSIRVDIGWPLTDRIGVDGDHTHTWWSVTKGF